jgi:hypothetical protein
MKREISEAKVPRRWGLVILLGVAVGVATLSSFSGFGPAASGPFCAFAPQAGSGVFAVPVFAPPAVAAAEEPAELVLSNGVIYTGDVKKPRVEAVAIRGERIVAAGTSKEIKKWVGSGTRVVDLKGRFAMPGFNDAHVHLASGGMGKLAVDVSGTRSLAEFQQRVRARLKDYKPGEWITGGRWDHTLWPEQRFPTRQDLDAVSKDHPMFFSRVDGHVAVANSKALELAGITRSTPNPRGGEIERDASGEATGMLKEGAAQGLVTRRIPPLSPEQRRRGIELAFAEATHDGVTSIQDNSGWDDFLIYQQLKKEGKLTVRVTEWLPFTAPVARLEELRKTGGTSDLWVRTGALKGIVDGALGGRTAALLAPYTDEPSSSGILIIDAERLKQMAVERDKAGFQIALHAIGDKANRVSLDAFAAALAANGKRDSRHRIEHAQIIAPGDISRFAQLGVIASMQPCHQTTDSRWAGKRLGPERSKGAYAWKSLQSTGARLAFGTDYSVEPINPMRGLFACVSREIDGQPGSTWEPQEKISLDDCIRAYTQGSAYAEFAEKEKGQIVPGQVGDVVVLSADVTKIPPAQILKTEVMMTIVGGRVVYEKK